MRLLAPALGILVNVSRLSAQTLPLPLIPAESPAEPDRPDLSESEGRTRPWEFAFGAGAYWDGNIDYLVPEGPHGVAVFPRGGLERVFQGTRGRMRATAAGGWTGHPGQDRIRRHFADVALRGGYEVSPGTRWRGGASYGLGYSDSSPILLEQGVSLPVVRTRSVVGTLGLSTRAGSRGTLRVDGRFYRTDFASEDLIDGESLRGAIGMERRFSPGSTAALEYALEGVLLGPAGASYLTHYGSLQWTRVLSPRSALLLEAGASHTPEAARAGLDAEWSFFGGGSFTRRLRGAGLTLFVRREVAPAFGTGRSRLELRAGLDAIVPLGRAWELRMLAIHVWPGSRHASGVLDARSHDSLASLGRRLGRRLELSAEARYRRRGPTSTSAAVEALQAGLFLTLFTPSGRSIAPAPALASWGATP